MDVAEEYEQRGRHILKRIVARHLKEGLASKAELDHQRKQFGTLVQTAQSEVDSLVASLAGARLEPIQDGLRENADILRLQAFKNDNERQA